MLIGVLFLLNELRVDLGAVKFWPAFLIIPGLGFWTLFFSKRGQKGSEGVLIPGTILLLLGLFFLYETIVDWQVADKTAFFYPLAVSLAFFAAYYLGDRVRGFLAPAWILLVVSAVVFFSSTLSWNFMWAVIFIAIGFWLLLRPRKKRDETKNSDQAQ